MVILLASEKKLLGVLAKVTKIFLKKTNTCATFEQRDQSAAQMLARQLLK